MSHTIRLALADDYPAICAYLEAHWRKEHIFTKSKALFDWQHWNKAKQHYHFVLGCAPDGAIHGVFGFVPNGQFDPALGYDTIFLCIWSVCEEARGQKLGTRMLDFIEETYKPTMIATNGASEMSLLIYQARGWETGKLEHWYMRTHSASRGNGPWEGDHGLPLKSQKYFQARYVEHPFYKYDAWHPHIAARICDGPIRVMRIVEFANPESLGAVEWRAIAMRGNVDFIDCYCAGVDAGAMMRAGFQRRISDEVIIPNYFEPYEHRNVDINYAVKAPKGMPWRITRGDGDMDRPNVLPC